ncbi:MAG: CopG family transcriptional regulator [Kiritimatiellia bacterium]
MQTSNTRATVYLDADSHRALKIKAVETENSVSDLINEAIRVSLLEDAEDLAACDARLKEPSLDFEDFLKYTRRRHEMKKESTAMKSKTKWEVLKAKQVQSR